MVCFLHPKGKLILKMKTICSFIVAGTAAALDFHMTELDLKFAKYVNFHNRNIKSQAEFDMRRAIFAEAEDAILENEEDPTSMHTMAHNMFSDRTDEEFAQMLGYTDYGLNHVRNVDYPTCQLGLDSDWDWR